MCEKCAERKKLEQQQTQSLSYSTQSLLNNISEDTASSSSFLSPEMFLDEEDDYELDPYPNW